MDCSRVELLSCLSYKHLLAIYTVTARCWRKTEESNPNPFGSFCFRNSPEPSSDNLPLLKVYSQQVSYVCCTVCYAHSLCKAPPGLGYVDKEYILNWQRVRDSNSRAPYGTITFPRCANRPLWQLAMFGGDPWIRTRITSL